MEKTKIYRNGKMTKELKNSKGITLVALVITIIILIILAGISINMILGQDGLIQKAKDGAGDYKNAAANELAMLDAINELLDGNGSTGGGSTPTPPAQTYTAYSIGDAVTIGGEPFFVIANSGTSEEMVTVIAKDCLTRAGDAQATAYSIGDVSVAFCSGSNSYWKDETSYPLDLNNYPVPNDVTSVVNVAKTYGTAKGGTGRLLTKDEANTLETTCLDLIRGKKDTIYSSTTSDGVNYWLGSADDARGVWCVYGSYGRVYYEDNFSYGGLYGVRPVIDISKSLIQ